VVPNRCTTMENAATSECDLKIDSMKDFTQPALVSRCRNCKKLMELRDALVALKGRSAMPRISQGD